MRARPGAVVNPLEVKIKVDEANFVDPGTEIARTAPTDGSQSSAHTASAYAQPKRSTTSAAAVKE
jgi:hypothetical protein